MSSYFQAAVARRGAPSAWDRLIVSSSERSGIPAGLVKAVISAESSWDPNVTDGKGSWGLMQLNVLAHNLTVAQALDPGFAIPFGAALLGQQLTRRLGSMELALAAYNAGTSRSSQDLENRIASNVNGVGTYVETVLDYWRWFQGNDPISAGAPVETVPAEPEPSGNGWAPPEAYTPEEEEPLPGDQVEPLMDRFTAPAPLEGSGLVMIGALALVGLVVFAMARR